MTYNLKEVKGIGANKKLRIHQHVQSKNCYNMVAFCTPLFYVFICLERSNSVDDLLSTCLSVFFHNIQSQIICNIC